MFLIQIPVSKVHPFFARCRCLASETDVGSNLATPDNSRDLCFEGNTLLRALTGLETGCCLRGTADGKSGRCNGGSLIDST